MIWSVANFVNTYLTSFWWNHSLWWDLGSPPRTEAVDGGGSFSAHMRVVIAFSSVLLTNCERSNLATLSWTIFVSHASLDVAKRPMIEIRFKVSKKFALLYKSTLLTSFETKLKTASFYFENGWQIGELNIPPLRRIVSFRVENRNFSFVAFSLWIFCSNACFLRFDCRESIFEFDALKMLVKRRKRKEMLYASLFDLSGASGFLAKHFPSEQVRVWHVIETFLRRIISKKITEIAVTYRNVWLHFFFVSIFNLVRYNLENRFYNHPHETKRS